MTLRVIVVEDSSTVREHLCAVLRRDPEIDVVAQASDGRRAIDLCRELRPDLVTMDMAMPVLSGLAATESIMAYCPTPILVVSSSDNRGEALGTCDALAAGAVDALDKPRGDETDAAWEKLFVARVKLVARVRPITHLRGRLAALGGWRGEARQVEPRATGGVRRTALVLGASTGGPGAIVRTLRPLPKGFELPILLVLHIGEAFGEAFAEWLGRELGRRVERARDGDLLADLTGRIVIASGDRHLTLARGRVCLTDAPPRHSCRPSVDVLFESAARELGAGAVGCLLTGMGRDGASGLLDIRRAGGLTVVQDESTSVVYGMPREAVLLGAVEHVLPLDRIGPFLAAACDARTEPRSP